MDPLFRHQVIDKHQFRLEGKVLVVPSISHLLILFFLLLWLGALIWWLTHNNYSRKETVTGWLEPVNGVVRLHAEGAGVVEKIMVEQGDLVKSGQELAIINAERLMREGSTLQSVLLNEYSKQQKIIQLEIERTKDIYKNQQSDIKDQIESASNGVTLFSEQLELNDRRAELISEQISRYKKLSSTRYVAAVEMDKTIAEQLEISSKRKLLLRSRLNLLNKKRTLKAKQLVMPRELANTLGQLQMRISNIEKEIKDLDGQYSYIVKASRAGIISNMLIKVGQFVSTGSALFTLEPKNNVLRARLLVPVSAAGFVSPGQELNIRYDAFPYQKFGVYKGIVKTVSDSVLLPSELKGSLVNVDKPVYRIEANIETPFVNAYGKRIPLKSGMTFSATVKLEDRTLLEWLLEPIYSLKGKL